MKIASGPASYMQKRVASIPCIYDLDERFRVMERFPEYVQVLTLGSPPVEALGEAALTRDLARLANDSMAELCRRHPDRFLGFAAALPMNDPDASVEETARAVRDLGALGVQIYTNVNGVPSTIPATRRSSLASRSSIGRSGCTRRGPRRRPTTRAS